MSQAFGILSVHAIAGAACCFGLVIMTKKGILLFGAIAATFMSCKHTRNIYNLYNNNNNNIQYLYSAL